MKTCNDCKHFIGGGDWGLCCDVKHPTPEEKKRGEVYPFGFLCYEDTKACDAFEAKGENK